MKRLVQFAAVLAIALLALQPALDGLACSLMHGNGAACPMAMSSMSPDCPMARQMAEMGCMQDCCNHAAPRPALATAVAAKSRRAVSAQRTVSAALSIRPEARFACRHTLAVPESSPPRYILNQVFRI